MNEFREDEDIWQDKKQKSIFYLLQFRNKIKLLHSKYCLHCFCSLVHLESKNAVYNVYVDTGCKKKNALKILHCTSWKCFVMNQFPLTKHP